MAIQHGNRCYVQLLLEPHKAELLKNEASSKGIRFTDHLRNLLYKSLERSQPASVFNEAQSKDEAVWKESVRRRVEGRKQARQRALESAAEKIIKESSETPQIG